MGSQRAFDDSDRVGFQGRTNPVVLGNAGMGQSAGGIGAALNQHTISSRPLATQLEPGSILTRRLSNADRPGNEGLPRPIGLYQQEGRERRRSSLLNSKGMPIGSDFPDKLRLSAVHTPPTGQHMPYTGLRLLQSTNRAHGAPMAHPTAAKGVDFVPNQANGTVS